MNTPEPSKKKILVIDDRKQKALANALATCQTEPPGLNSKARVGKKLTRKQIKRRKSVLLRRSQMVVCGQCHLSGGTMLRAGRNKEGEKLYIHAQC